MGVASSETSHAHASDDMETYRESNEILKSISVRIVIS